MLAIFLSAAAMLYQACRLLDYDMGIA